MAMDETEDYLAKLVGSSVKAVYSDNGVEKSIRGTLVSIDEIFIILKTFRDEIIPIGKRSIVIILPDTGGAPRG